MVKTAISLRKSLLDRVEAFIQRYENRKLLDAINAACDEILDQEEAAAYRDAMREVQRRAMEGET